MSTSDACVKSLTDLSIEAVCDSMTKETLKVVIRCFSPRITMKIIWEILSIHNTNMDFRSNDLNPLKVAWSYLRGKELTELACEDKRTECWLNLYKNHNLEVFAKYQQIQFVNRWNFQELFDLELFFRLVELKEYQGQLFIIFQICIQIKGYYFPQKFAQKWIESQKNDNFLKQIEQGLKLGTFFYDAGWFNESSLTLSYTYEIISSKWVCKDQNLFLMKSIQCLTKWLLATTHFYDFNKANYILKSVFLTVDKIKKMKENLPCLAYVYAAISEYYYKLMDYNQAYHWMFEAHEEVTNSSNDVIIAFVLSQSLKVCHSLKKWDLFNNIRDQIHLRLCYDKLNADSITYVMLSEAKYLLQMNYGFEMHAMNYYFILLDYTRNVFGYFNFNTASLFIDFAYDLYNVFSPIKIFNIVLHCVMQGIFILEQIGLPNDHLLLLNAKQLRALILNDHQNSISSIETPGAIQRMKKLRKKKYYNVKKLYNQSLEVSINLVGENTLLTANHYMNLGLIYEKKKKNELSLEMRLKAISIKDSILGLNSLDVAISLCYLGDFYSKELNKYPEAKQCFLRSLKIFEIAVPCPDDDFMNVLRKLYQVCFKLNDVQGGNEFMDTYQKYRDNYLTWVHKIDLIM